jgi:hypothetical protein
MWSRGLLGLLVVGAIVSCGSGAGTERQSAAPGDSVRSDSLPPDSVCNDVVDDAQLDLKSRTERIQAEFGFEIAGANELHDCQRLIDNNGKYGALVGLMVRKFADRTEFRNLQTIAEVRSTGEYKILKINPGRSCLVLQGSGTAWQAWVVPTTARCDGLAMPPDTLRLTVTAVPSRQDSAVQEAIRFEDNGERYFIGFRCNPQTWCVIGDEYDSAKHVKIPKHGWGDYQRLARENWRQHGTSNIWALLTPAPDLEGRTVEMYNRAGGNGLVVANVALTPTNTTPDSAKEEYRRRWDLPTFPAGFEIRLKHEGNSPETGWFTRYGSGRWKSAIHFSGDTHGGFVRWRWSENDERFWTACPTGCCGDGSEGR